MTNLVQRWLRCLSLPGEALPRKDFRLLMIGLDCAGKTTVLYKVKGRAKIETVIPTIGFNVEMLRYKNILFTAWDVGGCDKIRPLWRHFMAQTDAIIMVVDSADADRMHEAAEEMHLIVREEEAAGCPLLVLANKQDLPNKLTLGELRQQLDQASHATTRKVHLQPCCALTGEGLWEGLDWLSDQCTTPARGRPAQASGQTAACHSTAASSTQHASTAGAHKPHPGEPLSQQAAAAKVEKWVAEADDDDAAFLAGIDDCSGTQWDHYAHLRLAWLLLSKHGRREGKDRLFQLIKHFIANSSVTRTGSGPGRTFHETMTYFWMHMVHYAMACTAASASIPGSHSGVAEAQCLVDFKAFLRANPHLADGGLFLQYYTRELMLQDPAARTQVVLPDLQQLPSIVPAALVRPGAVP